MLLLRFYSPRVPRSWHKVVLAAIKTQMGMCGNHIDFTQNAGALAAVDADWVIATDLEADQLPTSTASIQYVSANVFEYQDALGLKASAYDNSGSVKSAEIFTQRSDILFGSLRMRAQVPSVPGAVFGFFTYIIDTQEQDIEFLSSDYYQHVYYTNQPGQLPSGNVDTQAAKNVEIPGADFTTFGVHRVDWLPISTIYSYAGSTTARASHRQGRSPKMCPPRRPSSFSMSGVTAIQIFLKAPDRRRHRDSAVCAPVLDELLRRVVQFGMYSPCSV
ncbi:hypothetical protein B0H17DRAFT_179232 [Mycena rosella]|uniref:GH16 domain-containing protein n=1 Tax=Mycena rosella TaxID=1033263 RepID=A0AAD7D0W7_MYCRO|nr:hypothetical protein B0H17DRAFT_179232 [Mycena rosella]